ncbi:conjugal transfer protein TraD [Sphingomonas sp. S2-65]|uniref:conjugal transfer protein TraD n=1 Tax=Sphingomonas sp. S2-65 TaxID=2903960 RepID=UPI001F299912|nr:conjugal transfer protein TraD [Sphingomonas sp. S2-65]UYY59298.1 conjugal transfer protein TraD [Sphingomonas sp. S2-65]
MRKPRDYESELKVLEHKARQLNERKLHQLGELVLATGANALPVEQLAGALLSAVESTDAATKEGWRKRGAAFFQATPRSTRRTDKNKHPSVPDQSSEVSASGQERA